MDEKIKSLEITSSGKTKEIFINGEKKNLDGVRKITIEVTPDHILVEAISHKYYSFDNEVII